MAITAPCAFVAPWAAAVIGIVAGVLVVVAVVFVEHKAKVDDPVGAVAVHGANGLWGMIALGLFADGRYGDGFNGVAGNVKGLVYGATGQLRAPVASVVDGLAMLSMACVHVLTLMKTTGVPGATNSARFPRRHRIR